MKEEVWGPIWGLAGTNGLNWLWVEQMAKDEAAGEGQGLWAWLTTLGFFVQGPIGRDGGNPRGCGTWGHIWAGRPGP